MVSPAPLQMDPSLSSDSTALEACLADVLARFLNSDKPVLVAGSGLRALRRPTHAFHTLAETIGCAVACQPEAKGLFDESHPLFIGTYWGLCSSPLTAEIVESCDIALLCGCVFTDYNTAGWTTSLSPSKCIFADHYGVKVCGRYYSHIMLEDFVSGLAKRIVRREKSHVNYLRFVRPPSRPAEPSNRGPLRLEDLRQAIERCLSPRTDLVVDVGDCWFLSQEMHLPHGATFHMQMLYGSTGWSIGAALGIAFAKRGREVIVLVGDGAFQMGMQEISTMIRFKLKVTVIVVNNNGYVSDRCILDGSYCPYILMLCRIIPCIGSFNDVQNWDYAGLVGALNGESGGGMGVRVGTLPALDVALEKARSQDGFSLIECLIARDDCSLKLLEWGQRVARSNMRPTHL